VWGLKERWALCMGLSEPLAMYWQRITYRGKVLQDQKTLKDEGLVGGETLVCLPVSEDERPIMNT
jgi:hypothetical protein